MTKNQISEGRGLLKQGLIAALIATMSISVLVSTTNASMAGAKNTKNSNSKAHSRASKNTKKTRGEAPFSPVWGDLCNKYGPRGSINYHGHALPAECSGDTPNPFATIYNRN